MFPPNVEHVVPTVRVARGGTRKSLTLKTNGASSSLRSGRGMVKKS